MLPGLFGESWKAAAAAEACASAAPRLASGWDPDLHPVAAGVGGAALPLRLPRLACSRDAAPALAGELAAGGGAGLSLLPRRPRAEWGRRVLETGGRGERLGRGVGGSGPAGKLRGRRGAAQGARCCWSPLGSSADRGHSPGRGEGCGCLTLWLLRGRRLQPPPRPCLLPSWSPGAGRSPREAEEGKRQKVSRDTKVRSAGVELRERAAQPRGEGRGAGPREEEPSRGEPAETKLGAASRWRVTPLSVAQSRGGGKVGNPRNRWGGGDEGAARYCRLRRSCFSQGFCARWFLLPNSAGELQICSLPSPSPCHTDSPAVFPSFFPSHPLLFG
ncbi:uncharacterized protein LOC129536082 [Moschus berezovskii]|uniref:uncharacterized protein LOC129536082 n=1 Tax=Moschus berezovskii TaxID=68408 RepID=UPI00244484B0|nr:uncharacterized protein LOC129536082 [Moschus berezovskii]